MSKIKFTDSQIEELKANPYTLTVTANQITFTREFKILFWSDYQNRMSPRSIFQKYGYDPEVLGRSRVTGFQQMLKREVDEGLTFHEGSRPPGLRKELTSHEEDAPSAKVFKDMQHRLEYLEQEMEFLKKIISVKNTRK